MHVQCNYAPCIQRYNKECLPLKTNYIGVTRFYSRIFSDKNGPVTFRVTIFRSLWFSLNRYSMIFALVKLMILQI